MNFPNDSSTQISTTFTISGSISPYTKFTDLDYNNIFNKPINFQSDWNSTVINKPTNFQSDWNSTIINKPTNFQSDYNSTVINTPNLSVYLTTSTAASTYQPILTFNNPLLNSSNNISFKYNPTQFNIDGGGNLTLITSSCNYWTQDASNNLNYTSGNVGIGTTTPNTVLEITGGPLNFTNDGTRAGVPTKGTYGGLGDRIIFWAANATSYPYSLGMNSNTLWYSVNTSASHIFYAGGTNVLQINSSGLTMNSGVISGSGSGITTINASNISSGTLNISRGGSGVTTGLTVLNASNITSGTLNISYGGTGVITGLTVLNATNVTSGTLNVAYGGTGTNALTAGQLIFGNGTSALLQSSNLSWNNATSTLTINGILNATTIQENGNQVDTLISNSLLPYQTISGLTYILSYYDTTSRINSKLSSYTPLFGASISGNIFYSTSNMYINGNTVDTISLRNTALQSYTPLFGASISGNIFYSTSNMYINGNTVDTISLRNTALQSYTPLFGATISGNIFYSTSNMYINGNTVDTIGLRNTALASYVLLAGGQTITGTLGINGATSCNSSLTVTSTGTFNSNVIIGSTSSGAKLDVGLVNIGNQTGLSAPSFGVNGGTGDKLILWSGDASHHPYSLGMNSATLWYSVPASGFHVFYVNGTSYFSVATSTTNVNNALSITGATTCNSTLSVTGTTTCNSTLTVTGTITGNSTLQLATTQGSGSCLRIEGGTSTNVANAISIGGYGKISVDYPSVGGGRMVLDDSGNLSLPRGTLTVAGATTCSSTLGVTSTLTVTGTTTCNSTLYLNTQTMSGGANVQKRIFINITSAQMGVSPYKCIIDMASIMSGLVVTGGTTVYIFRVTAWTEYSDFGDTTNVGTVCCDVFLSNYASGKARINTSYASGNGMSITWYGTGTYSALVFNANSNSSIDVVIEPISAY